MNILELHKKDKSSFCINFDYVSYFECIKIRVNPRWNDSKRELEYDLVEGTAITMNNDEYFEVVENFDQVKQMLNI